MYVVCRAIFLALSWTEALWLASGPIKHLLAVSNINCVCDSLQSLHIVQQASV